MELLNDGGNNTPTRSHMLPEKPPLPELGSILFNYWSKDHIPHPKHHRLLLKLLITLHNQTVRLLLQKTQLTYVI